MVSRRAGTRNNFSILTNTQTEFQNQGINKRDRSNCFRDKNRVSQLTLPILTKAADNFENACRRLHLKIDKTSVINMM